MMDYYVLKEKSDQILQIKYLMVINKRSTQSVRKMFVI